MRKDKQKAEQMRRAGKSYKEIKKKLGTPLTTLSDWFKNSDWSIDIRNRLAKESSFSNPEKLELMTKARIKKFATQHETYRQEAINEYPDLKKSFLFVAGLMLYWGEGDKNVNNSTIMLSNSDPGMIRVFNIFLLNVMGVPKEKIGFNLLLYPDLIETVQKKFWATTTGIPLTQFRKSVFIIGRHPTRRLSYGVGRIYVCSRRYKEKLMKWIELQKNEFINEVIAK